MCSNLLQSLVSTRAAFNFAQDPDLHMAITDTLVGGKPPFLFRAATNDTFSRASRGLNTETDIDPLFCSESEYHHDLLSNPQLFSTAMMMIQGHINYNYDLLSEFSSWSVSLLFVLQHGIRKFYALDEGDVLIYVMDTSRLPKSRLHYAPDLLKRYKLDTWAKYRTTNSEMIEYTTGEYLIHSKLLNSQGLWKAVSIRSLLDAGLQKVFPTFWYNRKDERLYQRLIELRKGYFGSVESEEILELSYNAEACLAIAECFGREFEGVVFLALLTSKRKSLVEDGIRWLHDTMFATVRLPKLSTSLDLEQQTTVRRIHGQWHGMLEAEQFIRLLHLLDDVGQASTLAEESEYTFMTHRTDGTKKYPRTLPWLKQKHSCEDDEMDNTSDRAHTVVCMVHSNRTIV